MRYPNQPNLHALQCDAGAPAFSELARLQPDSCVCLNVLEHIEDDAAALRRFASILVPRGAIMLLVPAFPALFGPIDQNLGHYRRYTRASIARLTRAAGLELKKVRYMNTAGFFGWWVNARILRREAQSEKQIQVFDRYVVPVMSRLEELLPPPFGQSLFAVLKKP